MMSETDNDEAMEEDPTASQIMPKTAFTGKIAASSSSPAVTMLPPIQLVSTCEEMNPSRRSSYEDCAVYAPAGTWGVPDPNMAFLCVCDGHGGRDMVEYLEVGLLYHVSQELQEHQDDDDDEVEQQEQSRDDCVNSSSNNNNNNKNTHILKRLEQAFLMADIHSRTVGVKISGATCAMALVTRRASVCSEGSDDTAVHQTAIDWNHHWTIYTANAGDARIVLGNRGEAFRLTKDHKTDDPEEVQRIESTGGFMFKGRVLGILAVTRSLGDHWYVLLGVLFVFVTQPIVSDY
jgi:serine/threonine protein phosphatase PrpC